MKTFEEYLIEQSKLEEGIIGDTGKWLGKNLLYRPARAAARMATDPSLGAAVPTMATTAALLPAASVIGAPYVALGGLLGGSGLQAGLGKYLHQKMGGEKEGWKPSNKGFWNYYFGDRPEEETPEQIRSKLQTTGKPAQQRRSVRASA